LQQTDKILTKFNPSAKCLDLPLRTAMKCYNPEQPTVGQVQSSTAIDASM